MAGAEHSRLLKYITATNQLSKMDDTPSIKIQNEYNEPKNVTSEVPGAQKIREVDDSAGTSEVEIKTADFSWSPVMTVTQKETTLTKEDMKMQKMTITEDISATEHGSFTKITYASQSSAHSQKSYEKFEENSTNIHKEGYEEKKSKIPIMRLRQVVERVKREREAQKAREKPRRSSIPRLKDPEKVKRQSSLQINPKTEDEFEKIYEEIVDNKQKEVDDKILAVNVEDTERVERKFEELISSLDDDVNERHTVTRISKIPALRRKDDETKLEAVIDKVKVKNTVAETQLKDGGFRVTASSIKTKRFSRGSSRDLSREEERVVTDTIDIKESEIVPTRTVQTSKEISKDGYQIETIERIEHGTNLAVIKQVTTKESETMSKPVKTEKIVRSVNKEMIKDGDNIKSKNIEIKTGFNNETVTKEIKNENGVQTITTTTIITDSKEIPRENKTVIREISKEMDEDEQNVNVNEDASSTSNETVTIQQHKDGDSIITTKTIVTETVKTSPVVTERIVRNINREISSESKETKTESNNTISKETVTKEVIKSGIPVRTERFTRGISIEMGNIKPKVKQETLTGKVADSNSQNVIKTTTITENVSPIKEVKTISETSKEVNNGHQNTQVTNKEITTTQSVENNNQKLTKETVVKESLKETTSTRIFDNVDIKSIQSDAQTVGDGNQKLTAETIVKHSLRDTTSTGVIDNVNIKSIQSDSQTVGDDNQKLTRETIVKESLKESTSTGIIDNVNIKSIQSDAQTVGDGNQKLTAETIVKHSLRESTSTGIIDNVNIKSIQSDSQTVGDDNQKLTRETIVKESLKESTSTGIIDNVNIKSIQSDAQTVGDDNQKLTKETIVKESLKESTSTGIIDNVNIKSIQSDAQTVGDDNQKLTKETIVKESLKESTSTGIIDNVNIKTTQSDTGIKKATMTTENVVVKEGIKIGIPQFTKVTESFSKGRIESVEFIKSVEWKPADNNKYNKNIKSVNENTTTREVKNETVIDDKSKEVIIEKQQVETSQSQPRDPILETKLKETLSRVGNKTITMKKVTEYESSETETNVEKNTYILSKSEQNIETATEKDTSKGLKEVIKETTDNKEIDYTIDSVKNKDINKESVTVKGTTETKETDNTIENVKDKDTTIESVTVLKGNVRRLKQMLSTSDSEDVVKKETKEELPKKKSILSKIAVFERLEPRDAYSVNKKITTEKNVSKLSTKQTFEEKTKTAEYHSKVHSNTTEIETKYNNEPVIVQEFWKTKEGYESTEISKGKIDLHANKNTKEITKTITEHRDVVDKVAENIKLLPAIINTQINNTDEVANDDIKTDHNHLEVPAVMSPSKPDFENEIGKTKPGKINLNIWEKQVKVNKTLVDKKEVFKTESVNEITKTFTGKAEIKTLVNQTEQSKELSAEIQVEVPSEETKIEIPKPEKSKLGKIDFSATDPIELPKILPDRSSPRPDTYEKEFEIGKVKPGKIDLTLWRNQIEETKTVAQELEIKKEQLTVQNKTVTKTKENDAKEVIKILPGNIEYSPRDIHIENPTMLPGTTNNDINSSKADISTQEKTITLEDQFVFLPAIIDSTPSENQIEDVKSTQKYIVEEPDDKNEVSSAQKYIVEELDDKYVDAPVILPGKLNLKAWENKVIQNKTTVGTNSFKTEEKEIEMIRTLPAKVEFMTYERRIEESKQSIGKIDSVVHENRVEMLTSQEFSTQQSSITTSSQKRETIEKISFATNVTSTEKSQIITKESVESAKELKVDVGKVEYPATVEKLRTENTNTVTIENNEIITKDSVETTKELKVNVNKAEFSPAVDPSESLSDPELVDENEVAVKDIKTPLMRKIKNKMFFITNRNIRLNSTKSFKDDEIEIDNQTIITDTNTQNRTENVTNEVKSTKETSNVETNVVNETKTTKELTNFERTASMIEETYINRICRQFSSTVQNSTEEFGTETSENEFVYYKDRANYGTVSESGIDSKATKEEMTRTKSLAELDLGNVTEGQVRRIVGRIKSVEFEKREEKKEKINAKEMPKKMSVLEKIALFESKAASASFTSTTIKRQVTKKSTLQVLSEEEYVRRIEGLKSARTTLGRLEEMMYIPLNNGVEMPIIALGTALMDTRLLPHLIGAAIDLGYRAFDTAYIYGNEKEVGEALRAKIDDGTVKREDLFIMSKLWSTFHRQDLVEEACRNSLKAMGLAYFDLYMIHNPMSFKEGTEPMPKIASVMQYSQHDYLDAWFGMEHVLDKGLARSIGVSNFNSQQIQKILDRGRVKPVVNQVECHPYLSQQRLHEFCAERNITLSCYGVLGSKGTPAEFKGSTTAVIDDPLVQVMASGLNVSPAQLLIRYQIECGHNVVVKTSNEAHLWDNLQALTFTLTDSQVDALHALNRNKRTFTFKGMGDTHKNYPFKILY